MRGCCAKETSDVVGGFTAMLSVSLTPLAWEHAALKVPLKGGKDVVLDAWSADSNVLHHLTNGLGCSAVRWRLASHKLGAKVSHGTTESLPQAISAALRKGSSACQTPRSTAACSGDNAAHKAREQRCGDHEGGNHHLQQDAHRASTARSASSIRAKESPSSNHG